MSADNQPCYIQPHDDTVLIREDFTAELILTNIINRPTMFKIRTTAPNFYVVKPHYGTLQVGKIVNVRIQMKRVEISSLPSFSKDKFQINAIPIPENIEPGTLSDPNAFQKVWEEVSKGMRQSRSLKVGFSMGPEAVSRSKLFNQYEMNTSVESKKESPEMFYSGKLTASEVEKGQSRMSVIKENEEFQGEDEDEEGGEVNDTVVLEKKVAELEREAKAITASIASIKTMNEELVVKAEKQQGLLDELVKEKERINEELGRTKTSAFVEPMKSSGNAELGIPLHYPLWQVIMAVVLSFLVGSLLSE